MHFITYINQFGSFKTALVNYDPVAATIETQNAINEDYLVTSVFVEGVKRLVDIDNPVQLAVINDNNFDGNLLDLNHYNVEGTYFSAKLLPLVSVGGGSASQDVNLKQSIPLTVLRHDVDVKSMPIYPFPKQYNVPFLVPVWMLSGAGSLNVNSAFIKASMEIRLYGDGTNGVVKFDTYQNSSNSFSTTNSGGGGIKFINTKAISLYGNFLKASTTFNEPYNDSTYWKVLLVHNIRSNEFTIQIQKYNLSVPAGALYDLSANPVNLFNAVDGGFSAKSLSGDVTITISKDYIV